MLACELCVFLCLDRFVPPGGWGQSSRVDLEYALMCVERVTCGERANFIRYSQVTLQVMGEHVGEVYIYFMQV